MVGWRAPFTIWNSTNNYTIMEASFDSNNFVFVFVIKPLRHVFARHSKLHMQRQLVQQLKYSATLLNQIRQQVYWKFSRHARIHKLRINFHWYHQDHARSLNKACRVQWNQRDSWLCPRWVLTWKQTSACDCDTRGTQGAATTCDIETGQCICKENVGGQACDVCKVCGIYFGFYLLNKSTANYNQLNRDITDNGVFFKYRRFREWMGLMQHYLTFLFLTFNNFLTFLISEWVLQHEIRRRFRVWEVFL